MPPISEGPPEEGEAQRPLGKRLAWFAALWVGRLCAVAAVAYALRTLILSALICAERRRRAPPPVRASTSHQQSRASR